MNDAYEESNLYHLFDLLVVGVGPLWPPSSGLPLSRSPEADPPPAKPNRPLPLPSLPRRPSHPRPYRKKSSATPKKPTPTASRPRRRTPISSNSSPAMTTGNQRPSPITPASPRPPVTPRSSRWRDYFGRKDLPPGPLYLLHGYGGSHRTWRNKAADIILQNLYFEKRRR